MPPSTLVEAKPIVPLAKSSRTPHRMGKRMGAMRIWVWFLVMLAVVALGVRITCRCWDKVAIDCACLVVFISYLRTMSKTHRQ